MCVHWTNSSGLASRVYHFEHRIPSYVFQKAVQLFCVYQIRVDYILIDQEWWKTVDETEENVREWNSFNLIQLNLFLFS